jgi:hypothetical protein
MIVLLTLVFLAATGASPNPGTGLLPLDSATMATPSPLPVSAEVRLAKGEVSLGEEFEVEVVVRGPVGTSWTYPAEASAEDVELRSLARAASPGAWPPDTHRYAGVLYALGDVELPALVVRYRLPDGTEGEVTPATVKIHSLSVFPKSEEERKLADVRPPVGLGVGRAFWITLLGLLLFGLAAFFVWRRSRRGIVDAETSKEPAVAPDLEALEALRRLVSQSLAERGDLRGHYIALTTIARRYLERRLGAPVLEMTTAESVAFLRDDARGRECAPVMRDVSGAADAIKFARGTAAIEEASRHLEAVRGMIGETEARLAAMAAAEQQAAANVLASAGAAPALRPSGAGEPLAPQALRSPHSGSEPANRPSGEGR